MHRLKVRGWKKCKKKLKGSWGRLPLSDKIDFKIKTVTRDREEHYIMVKESVEQEDITNVNICIPNTGAPKYIKHIWTNIKGEVDSNTIIVGDLYPLHQRTDHPERKLPKETLALKHIRPDG